MPPDRHFEQHPSCRKLLICPFCRTEPPTFAVLAQLQEWRCYHCGSRGTIKLFPGGDYPVYPDLPDPSKVKGWG